MILWRNLDLQRWQLMWAWGAGELGTGAEAAGKGSPCHAVPGRRRGLPGRKCGGCREQVRRTLMRSAELAGGFHLPWRVEAQAPAGLGVGNACGARGDRAREAPGQG